MRSFFGGLSFRVTFWVSLVVVAIVSIHIALMRPGERLILQKEAEALRVARIVEGHLQVAMTADRVHGVQPHLAMVPELHGIRRVEVVDATQTVRFSSDEDRLGLALDILGDMPCRACHARDPVPSHAIVDDATAGRLFVAGHTLENRPLCRRCHASDGDTLGTVVVELELAETDEAALSVRNRLISVGSGLLVVMVVGMGSIIHTMVGRPARSLLGKMRRLEAANFAVGPPQSSSRDEFGALDRGFHNMARQLADVYDEMDATIRERTDRLYQTQAQVMHQEKLAGIGQLAAGVAHEIGNPLTAIDSLVQLLAADTDDEVTRERVRTIQGQVDRISEIVHNMADLSRPLAHEAQMVDVNVVLQSVLRLVHYDARFRNVEPTVTLADDLPPVWSVEDHLFGVFLNLVLNAVDAMPAGGRLGIASSQVGDVVEVRVRDTGHGIPIEDQARIFEPYFTTKGVGHGTGLGLSVCREFLDRLGGDITVESEPGAGSTFVVRIPIETTSDPGGPDGA